MLLGLSVVSFPLIFITPFCPFGLALNGRLGILKSKRFYCRGGRSLELDHSPTQGGASA